MDLLLIGGTQFVGRALVEKALERGHKVTMFNRGKTNPDLFPEVERIIGDRDGDLEKLGDRTWDAVIDTVGYFPRVVKASADYLKGKVKQYVFISTISVYDLEKLQPNGKEDSPLAALEDPTVEEIRGDTYGGLKVLCEQAVMDAFPDSYLIVRPGLIVGPYDPSNRLPYWIGRMDRGGDVLVPDIFDQPVQFVDARDLASFTLDHTEKGTSDIFHVTGPDTVLHFGDVIEASIKAADANVSLKKAAPAWLIENEVQPFSEMPLWVPPENAGIEQMGVDVSKPIGAGLTFLPLQQTIEDTLAWIRSLDGKALGNAGLAPEKEAALLAKLED
ncbi:MAG: NAD-dependent epimerase/dehydratase family protein [Anaerolineae bacterium]|nr:NAD-dependent epimerase/dehydratase family protein [Anaerolineae bacterium]